jgi:hypothetical protein
MKMWLSKLLGFRNNALQFKLIRENPANILTIDNPTEKMKLLAVGLMPSLIAKLENLSEPVLMRAIKACPKAIALLSNPSEKLQFYAIEEYYKLHPREKLSIPSSHILKSINNPTFDMMMMLVKTNGYIIKLITNPCEVLQIAAVLQNPDCIRYIDNPCELATLQAKIHGYNKE